MATTSTKNIAYALYESVQGKQGKELEAIVARIPVFLAEKHLLSRSQDILQSLQEIVDEKEGIVRGYIESADTLEKETLKEIEHELKKRYDVKEVDLEIKIQKKHIRGIKIRVKDEVIDLTLANRITQLQNHLIAH